MTTKESTLLNWIGKEKDNESKLGDHGVRKYEYETGRFISIDPLWAKYYGWSPYQYSRNNPIYSFDITGKADFFLSDGSIKSDGTDDNKLYASGNFDLNSSMIFNSDGTSEIDFQALRSNSKELPNKDVMKTILSLHNTQPRGEAGGVGTMDKYFYGGRNHDVYSGDRVAESTNEVLVGFYQAFGNNELPNISYFVHDHPYGGSDNPSDADRSFLDFVRKGVNNFGVYGILIQGKTINFFDANGEGNNDVKVDRKTLEDVIE